MPDQVTLAQILTDPLGITPDKERRSSFTRWPTAIPALSSQPHYLEGDYTRPGPPRIQTDTAETLSPTMGGYSLGQLLADSYGKAQEGDWSGVADRMPMLAPAIFGFGKARLPGRLTPAIKVLPEGGAPGVYARGPTHGDALTDWLEARRQKGLPEIGDNDWDRLNNHVIDGYTTEKGDFLDRQQAQEYLGIKKTHGGLESGEIPGNEDW